MTAKRIFVVYQESRLAASTVQPGGISIIKTFEPGQWRFRVLAARNKKIVASSGEAFDSKSNAVRAAKREASLYAPGVAAVEVLA